MRGSRLMRRVGMRSRMRFRSNEGDAAWPKPCRGEEPDGPQRYDEHSAAKRQPNELESGFPRQRLLMVSALPPGSRPGGTPQEISRGQVRASGRRPRIVHQKNSLPQRGIEEADPGPHCPAHQLSVFSSSARPLPRMKRSSRVARKNSSMPRRGTAALPTPTGGRVRSRGLAPG